MGLFADRDPGATAAAEERAIREVFTGESAMAALMREIDWAATPLGPVAAWPQSLRTSVSICLSSRFPLLIWWGPELVKLYNDAYRPMLGAEKHPRAMGAPGREVWSEIWHIIGPMLDRVMKEGEASWSDDLLLPMVRNGYLEEAYFTFSYSPIRDESGGIGGVFTAVTETTERVLSERRLRTLQELAVEARTVESTAAEVAQVLARHALDIPFALIYLLDEDGRTARLAGSAGFADRPAVAGPTASGPLSSSGPLSGLDGTAGRVPAAPAAIRLADSEGRADDGWPLAAAASGRAVLVEDLSLRFGPLPGSPWPDATEKALILPIARPGMPQLAGFLVLGVSPRRALDDAYRGFFELVANHVATAIASARAYEEERRRAESLAELDRAKTEFFSNISHEFRTPLTLLLGPLEEILAGAYGPLASEQKEVLDLAQRNGLRLLKLVNTLLDFSRIEAGRTDAFYEPVDLAALTTDLASVFRSAVERAGLRLIVDCPPLPEAVYVDREMWEKIVLNLLSNALKFTMEGEITVRLRQDGAFARLDVQDTGAGIGPELRPHIFERFYRLRDQRARTFEGTGIGLALVQELVRLNGGSIEFESAVGEGTTFTVSIPFGSAHLSAGKIGDRESAQMPAARARPYVEEALRWADGDTGERSPLQEEDSRGAVDGRTPEAFTASTGAVAGTPAAGPVGLPCILVADDNADMREYIRRILSEQYETVLVADGRAALAAIKARQPNVLIADIMMPRLDGLGLLRALRAEPRTASLPVILLSARAGEDARAEGLEAGANDYMIKPFTARALLASVSARLAIAAEAGRREQQALRESEERFRSIFENAGIGITVVDPAGRYITANRAVQEMLGYSEAELRNLAFTDLSCPEYGNRDREHFEHLLAGRSEFYQMEMACRRKDGAALWVSLGVTPVCDAAGRLRFAIRVLQNVTARKEAEFRAQEAAEQREAALARLKEHDEQLKVLSRRLLQVQENERRAIARELHDEAGQALTALKLTLGRIAREHDCPPAVAESLAGVVQDVDGVMEGLHRVAVDLRPASLDRVGLVPAVDQYIASMPRPDGLELELEAIGLASGPEHDERVPRLPSEVETALYRIVQEALTNIVRHAHAHLVGIVIRAEREETSRVVLVIEDDGVGFEPGTVAARGRLGLTGMRERTEMLGGTFTVESQPGAGTTLFVEIPI